MSNAEATPPDASADEAAGGNEQSFISHLIELRARLLKAIAAVLVVLVALLPFADRMYHFIAEPLLQRLPQGAHMIAIEVASPFMTPVKLAAVVALFLAMPAVLYQLWRFVAPGLYRHEKKMALPLLVASVGMFYLGCAFAYYLVLPKVFVFLLGVTPDGVAIMTDIGKYLDFVLTMFLAFGVCFEVPVVVFLLALLGVVNAEQLTRQRPYVVLGVFVIAAVLAPPDALSMLMLAIPMCLLYELGVVAVRLFVRRAQTGAQASPKA
ncbi:MAG: twin-arginine translocase subunit TatC [Deltaproteobacteria bacterium]|jgi:sec-independent protein translocase protein TatC|nr:twin-arginine translocase subunit TatC [Rudaea sp.]